MNSIFGDLVGAIDRMLGAVRLGDYQMTELERLELHRSWVILNAHRSRYSGGDMGYNLDNIRILKVHGLSENPLVLEAMGIVAYDEAAAEEAWLETEKAVNLSGQPIVMRDIFMNGYRAGINSLANKSCFQR
jgi:hypothetical protein